MWETNSSIKSRTEGQVYEKQELLTENQFRKRCDEMCKTRVVGIKIWEYIWELFRYVDMTQAVSNEIWGMREEGKMIMNFATWGDLTITAAFPETDNTNVQHGCRAPCVICWAWESHTPSRWRWQNGDPKRWRQQAFPGLWNNPIMDRTGHPWLWLTSGQLELVPRRWPAH